MKLRALATAVFACLLTAWGAQGCLRVQAQRSESPPDFRQLLQQMAQFSPDPCGPPHGEEKNWDSSNIEVSLFSQATNIVAQALNASPATSESPERRAATALKTLEQTSAKVNAAWPAESRFHFSILDLPPALVVKMSIRAREAFSVFGMPEEVLGKPSHSWQSVGSNEESSEFTVPPSQFNLFALHRGPSGNARFLAKAIYSGCAGSLGVAYDAQEWNPKGAGDLEQVIKQEGSFGLDEKVAEFPQVGKLQTEGALITLPYCWFSAIDTWDNPSLCAVDTYDLSGDDVRFRSRAYNRPDLVPIAKGIEYAEKRDYPAVIGYCTSDEIAQKMVRELPPDFLADDVRVTRLGDRKERVELGDPAVYLFEVEKRADRWVIVAFSTE